MILDASPEISEPGLTSTMPVGVAVRDLARGALAEELVELLLLHLQQIRQVERHPGSL